MQFIYLIILGVLAGIVAAVASMASLVSYPGLLLFGLSPVSANMTNTAALVTTGFGSLSSCLKEMRGNWGEFWRYAFFQLTGALIGGWLLVKFPGKIFQKLVPFFVLFSAGLLLYSGRQKQPKQATKLGRIGAYFGLFVAGIYAGYFGAASGVLTLIFLTALSDSSFVVINAIKSVIGSLANLVALALLAFKGGGNWPVAFTLAIGLFIGGYFGQKMIKYLKPAWVRWITACFSVLLAIYLGWRAWG